VFLSQKHWKHASPHNAGKIKQQDITKATKTHGDMRN